MLLSYKRFLSVLPAYMVPPVSNNQAPHYQCNLHIIQTTSWKWCLSRFRLTSSWPQTGDVSLLALVNLGDAFKMVDYDILLQHLCTSRHIDDLALDWFKSCLNVDTSPCFSNEKVLQLPSSSMEYLMDNCFAHSCSSSTRRTFRGSLMNVGYLVLSTPVTY